MTNKERKDKWLARPKNRLKHNQRNKEYYQKKVVFLDNYKKNKNCNNCGWNLHPEILQFHHVNPEEKVLEINSLMCVRIIKKEILKCILLCPNCHFWLHHPKYKLKQIS